MSAPINAFPVNPLHDHVSMVWREHLDSVQVSARPACRPDGRHRGGFGHPRARPQAGEGMVTGDVVNTALRLQGFAPVVVWQWERSPTVRPGTDTAMLVVIEQFRREGRAPGGGALMRHVKGQGDNGPGRPPLKEIVEAAADAPPNLAVQRVAFGASLVAEFYRMSPRTRGELGPGKSPRE